MSYLRLIEDKIHGIAEDITSTFKVDVTVVDENLVRIVGTGNFYSRINENSPRDSLFAKILHSGKPEMNTTKTDNHICKQCSYFVNCKETSNMIHPIIVEGKNIGIISFAAFDVNQKELMIEKREEYFKILQQLANTISNEIINIKITNRLDMEKAEVNEIINSINKGIIVVNSEDRITHINARALKSFKINLSKDKIIKRKISTIIKNLKIRDTNNKEILGTWEVGERTYKVLYKINDVVLDEQKVSTLISFDEVRALINTTKNLRNNHSIEFSSIIGKSTKLVKVIERAKISAQTDSAIILKGESGTGKELFARAIHNASPRKYEPFIAINCASIPENLLESELFGYEKGAFTGANTQGKMGKFELANNGTLFLDEIGDLPLHLQPKLLRVLQEKEIVRVGGNTPIKIDVRIISATHRNLENLIKNKRFRHDLYYRLNVIPLSLPPLRERENDVLLCAEYILQGLSERMDTPKKHLSREVEEKFLLYEWPGNIRELENALEYASNFAVGTKINLEDLPEYFFEEEMKEEVSSYLNINGNLEKIISIFEKDILKKYLEIFGDSTEGKKKIARKLGISLTTLYRKLNDMN